MQQPLIIILGISALIFCIALLYSSVGHGGASGYLAVLSFFAFLPGEIKSTALILNILVAGIASVAFMRAGYFSWKLLWPFIIASIPAAFLGGIIKISPQFYALLLALVLLVAAWRLALPTPATKNSEEQHPIRLPIALTAGGGIGLLSGIVGIGGGIFLSPLILLARWADAKRTAAISAAFILVNSVSGLAGHLTRQHVDILAFAPFLLAALCGGLLGSHLGANHFSGLTLRRTLAVVLVLAAGKLLLPVFLPI
ncbi:MAG: sulfite exporter TauE/SafE family protein [Armatimonadota bacterium]